VAKVEFFFDCSSPWTYLAFHNLLGMQADLGFAIAWRPILVGGIFNTVNPSVYRSREQPVPAKEAYVAKDLADWARVAGLVIRWKPSIFPVNSAKAMRGCLVAEERGLLVPFARGVFEAYWRDDRDIAEPNVVAGIAEATGLGPADFLAAIERPEIRQRLRDNGDELVRRGGFGSPTMFVNGDDMYFGNDRLKLVRAAIIRSSV
jgi:2-hydroxychromene-2-carboxylate isomerase